MDRSLMTAGIHAHTGDQIGAGSGTVDAEFPLDVGSGVIVEVAEHGGCLVA